MTSENQLLVFIEGVFQQQDAYSIATSSGTTTLTFSAAPVSGRSILIYSVASAISGTNLNVDSMVGDGSDTTLTLSIAPVSSANTQVYVSGVYQNKDTYSVSGTTLTFTTAPPSGAAVQVMTMNQTQINVPVDGTITSAKLSGALTTPSTLTATGKITADAGIDVDDFNIDGTRIFLTSGDMTVQSAGSLILNTNDGVVKVKDGNSAFGAQIDLSDDNNVSVSALIQNKDILLKGSDSGTPITALSLDMSAAGAATFNSSVTAKSLTLNTDADSSFSIVDAGTDAIFMKSAAGDELYIGANNTYAIRILNNGTNGVVLDNASKLGIGVAAPQSNVDIDVAVDTSLGLRSQTGLIVAQYTGAPAVGNRSQIGLGYGNSYTNVSIGAVRTSASAYGTDDFIIATKGGTADAAPTERMRVLSTGGITFNGDTAADNALDDYEQGAWTPVLNSGSLTNVRSLYRKIGNQVTAQFYVTGINPSANTLTLKIDGLPYPAQNETNYYASGTISYSGNAVTSGHGMLVPYNSSFIYFHLKSGSGGPAVSNNNWIATVGSGQPLIASITYFTA